MRRDPRMYLYDIATAADAIMTFTAGLTRDGYIEDDLTRSAVERKFEIIGEAINQLAKISPKVAERIAEAREAIAFRNVLAHAFFWSIMTSSGEPPSIRFRGYGLMWQLSSKR